MADRGGIERLLRRLYAARVGGNIDAVCATFADDAVFRISGASYAKPIAINAASVGEFRPWLALMIKAFRLSDLSINSIIIDGSRAAAHWQVNIHSRITGMAVLTELIDLVEVRDERIVSYIEFFVPR